MVIKSISRLLSGNDVSSSSGDVPSEVVTKGGDDKTAVTLDDDYTQPSFEDFQKETVAGIKKMLVEQSERTDEVLENQDQMQSTLSDVKDTTSKTEAKVDALSYSLDALAKDVKETKTPSKTEMKELFKDAVAESLNPATMQGLFETFMNSAVKKNKDNQGGQLKTPATKKKKRNADSATGRPPISTAKKSRPSTLSIPGVEKHTMRQSEDAKKLAFDKKREGRIVT
mmetsp:Transcript_25986/g.44154  ORF Transcript_25986/g.44154 Transcript_25986/m.44154 type:complete len:227 (-) Transcript_25986:781-1461(-)